VAAGEVASGTQEHVKETSSMKMVGRCLAGLAVVFVLGTAVAAPAAADPLGAGTGAEAKAAAIAAKVTARADAVSAKLGALQGLLGP